MTDVYHERRLLMAFRLAIACALSLALLCFGFDRPVLAAPQLSVSAAVFKAGQLTVSGSYKSKRLPADSRLRLHDRKLGTQLGQISLSDLRVKRSRRAFRFSLGQPYDIPCAVRVSAEGTKDKFKTVRGAPRKNCSTGKTPPVVVVPTPAPVPSPSPAPTPTPTPAPTPSLEPLCEILEPVAGAALTANTPVTFRGWLKANDPAAPSLSYEWDFAGGAMERPKGSSTGQAEIEAHPTFIRDNSAYRVRLAATDTAGRRCEAALNVVVGQIPVGLPDITPLAAASRQTAPAVGNALQKPAGEKVVLPFEDWTMQCGMDTRMTPSMYQIYGPQVNTVNAYVYEKGLQPKPIGSDQVDLVYYAASNPNDPVGANSINSTSQNWPLSATLLEAALGKTDIFERFVRPPGTNRDFADGYQSRSLVDTYSGSYGGPGAARQRGPDEGASGADMVPPLNPDHGRYMPGIASPYAVNEPQSFSEFVPADNWFAARWLPVSDVDDAGRINPYPLFRVEARDPGSKTPLAATDTVVTTGRDFHCRECHAKGGIAANPNTPRVKGKPYLFDAASDSVFDREYAALRNAVSMHEFNDFGIVDDGQHHHGGGHNHGNLSAYFDLGQEGDPGLVYQDIAGYSCTSYCHSVDFPSLLKGQSPRSTSMGQAPRGYWTNSSSLYHRFHGRLQYNADKTDILRDAEGRYVRFDSETQSNPNSLFPVKDAQGKPLPMEQNCLKCHSGQREQCYRDRMYTAGVTCYQCHGDMLAVGNMFRKSRPGPDGKDWREPWLDQPDCASCHTGNANRGKDGSGYFSAAARKTAFDEADPSATPFQPDRTNPDESRFAVPVSSVDTHRRYIDNREGAGGFLYQVVAQSPLFRLGKDNHGQVACAACHGSAHAIWPNRDPNANDNVTANQLQGHTGAVLECGVCHSRDAFAKLTDLDEGQKNPAPTVSVLGGPHNLHPVNDPTWWQTAKTPKGATVVGGWHVSYTAFVGKAGEDQCVACHGNDRLGTRLSKTPVDREFVDDQGRAVSVKAGTPIGCQLCHSIIKSCVGSPGPNCGEASDRVANSTSQPPRLTSSKTLKAVIGTDFTTQLTAADPDGDPLSFRQGASIEGVTLDAAGGDMTIASTIFDALGQRDPPGRRPPFEMSMNVVVSDNHGAFTVEPLKIVAACPDNLVWDNASRICSAIAFVSEPFAQYGIDAGTRVTHRFKAQSGSGLPVTYALYEGAPEGLTLDPSGLLNWDSSGAKGDVGATVIARDNQGNEANESIQLVVCAQPMHWNNESGLCVGAVHIQTPERWPGVVTGETFRYQVLASHDQGKALHYTLPQAPEGMAVSASGLVTWPTSGAPEGQTSFQVLAADGAGNEAVLDIYVNVCATQSRWLDDVQGCSTLVTITSYPAITGMDAGKPFQYHFKAQHLDNAPLTYRLEDAPPGMTLDPVARRITWPPERVAAGQYQPVLIASDAQGIESRQQFPLAVCSLPTHWDESSASCLSPDSPAPR